MKFLQTISLKELFLISNNPLSPTPSKVELLRLVFVRRKHILCSSWVKSSSVSLGLLIVPVGFRNPNSSEGEGLGYGVYFLL